VSPSTPYTVQGPSKYTSPCFQQLRTAKMGIPKFLYCPTLPQMARALNQKRWLCFSNPVQIPRGCSLAMELGTEAPHFRERE
jgi:hypothetical protein